MSSVSLSCSCASSCTVVTAGEADAVATALCYLTCYLLKENRNIPIPLHSFEKENVSPIMNRANERFIHNFVVLIPVLVRKKINHIA
jgi:hypothetical protein